MPLRRLSHLCSLLLLDAAAGLARPERAPQQRRRQRSAGRAAAATGPWAVEDVAQPLEPPGGGKPWPVTYTSDAGVVDRWLAQHNDGVLGFDTETRPVYRKGESRAPATLQLAGEGACLVVQLTHLDPGEKGWPAGLVDCLANASVLKIGVGIDNDAIDVWRHYGYSVCGRLDLGGVQAEAGAARRQVGLRSLASSYLGVDLQKSNSIAKSNWELRPLSLKQLSYAAMDSWVGREVFLVLAARAPATFAPVAARRHVGAERPLASLVARRLMRRAVKEAAARLHDELQALLVQCVPVDP